MKDKTKINIIDTLSYFDIFNYPLTLEQFELFLHKANANKDIIEELISEISIIEKKHGYYFFSGRDEIAVRRKINEEENLMKFNLAKQYIFFISKVPGVRMVGITGSLAMQNASKEDDIDLFIVTRKNTLWTTRILVNLIAKILGVKRDYKSHNVANKLCLNMFLDERNLEFENKNLYVAHEIAQMKTFFSERKTFERLLKKNLWVQKYFPNIEVRKRRDNGIRKLFEFLFFSEKVTSSINALSFMLQYLYMKRKITNEKITMEKAFFHPHDHSKDILDEYERRKEKYISLHKKNLAFSKMNLDILLHKKARLAN